MALGPPNTFLLNQSQQEYGTMTIVKEQIPNRMAIKGIAVLTCKEMFPFTCLDSSRAAEYVILYTPDSSAVPGTVIDSLRWDTAQPHIMLLPQTLQCEQQHDTTRCITLTAYEAMFDSAVIVDTTFLIGGTFNSNLLARDGYPRIYKNFPSIYAYIQADGLYQCLDCSEITTFFLRRNTGEMTESTIRKHSGPFLLIPADLQLTVLSDSLPMGTATGSGTYRSDMPIVVTATAAPYCRFDHWSDGSTDNPRVMYLYSDSTITAHFNSDSNHYLRVLSNNPDWGETSASAFYPDSTAVTISATAYSGYAFTEWADGSTSNPRTVLVTSDTVFTAIFDPLESIDEVFSDDFSITPNPTLWTITVSTATSRNYTILIYDNTGKPVMQHSFYGQVLTIDISELPAGSYNVLLNGDNYHGVKKIIKL